MRLSKKRASLLLVGLCVSALITSCTAWVGSSTSMRLDGMLLRSRSRGAATLTMDVETPSRDAAFLQKHQVSFRSDSNGRSMSHKISIPRPQEQEQHDDESVEKAERSHGMPWKTSIDPTYTEDSLFYMQFWEYQMTFMKKHLTNLRAIPVTSGDKDMSYIENTDKKIRMHTCAFQSDEYKCIRMTVYDAGNATQVFTSLWYPDPSYNLPVLGIDLLQFNKKKHLCIVDFQPIQSSEHEHDQSYEHLLQPIRDQYESLQGRMTPRFYDENQFFSKQMLFGRHDATEENPADKMVFQELLPAFQSYVQTHVDLVQSTTGQADRIPAVLERHAAYDSYSAVRDPAHALLARSFGQEWADNYVFDVLFPSSQRPSKNERMHSSP